MYGSETAMEMLVRLPGVNESVKVCLFDYEFESLLMDEPAAPRRRKFGGAYKIDEPLTPETRWEKFKRILADVNGM
jgi:hypothetical protein